jgi:hypothetical protein
MQIYWCDSYNGNDSNDGDVLTPFKTINKALSIENISHTIINLETGIYDIIINNFKNISINNYNDSIPAINKFEMENCKNILMNNLILHNIKLISCENNKFINCKIILNEYTEDIIITNGNTNVLFNCVCENCNIIINSSNNIISKCKIINCVIELNGNDNKLIYTIIQYNKNEHDIKNLILIKKSYGNIINNCFLLGTLTNGIFIEDDSHDWIIHDNIIETDNYGIICNNCSKSNISNNIIKTKNTSIVLIGSSNTIQYNKLSSITINSIFSTIINNTLL